MKLIYVLNILLFFYISICSAQSPPVTVNDGYTTEVDTPLNIDSSNGLLSNDSDPDGDTLTIDGFIINGTLYNPGQTVAISGGSITLNTDGSLNFTPGFGFDGSIPLIVYTVSDGSLTSYSNLNISITRPGPPEATPDFDTTDINSTLSVPAPGVLANDAYEHIDSVSVFTFTVNGLTFNAGQTADTGVGDITIFDDGSYIFVPVAGYTGDVPGIIYEISDEDETSTSFLFLSVQPTEDIIQLNGLSSCNQGYTPEGDYKIQYRLDIRNLSNALDYHSSSMINTIQVVKDFASIYGPGCVIELDNFNINTPPVDDFIGNPYPIDFDNDAVNQDFINGTESNLFTDFSVDNSVLYPRQRVTVTFCLIVQPFCNGRPNPTPSGSGIDFEAELNLTSSNGDLDSTLLLEDFHTTEAIITAGFFIPENSPPVNPDGTYDFTNTIVIKNDGNAVANNVNFNLGLGSFIDNTLSFNTLTVTQVSGPPVNINANFDGDTNSLLLQPGNSLAPNESITLEIFHILDPVGTSGNINFSQVNPSQTQGILDGFDENLPENSRIYSFAIWEDGLGNHLDRYYTLGSLDQELSNDQCICNGHRMTFSFTSSSSSLKEIVNIDSAPGGILEYEEITFHLTVTNTSPVVELTDLILQDNLTEICDVDPISTTTPEIVSSTATIDPNINPNYDGINDIDIFDGSSGLINTGEFITVEITLVFSEDCVGENTINFSGVDPVGNLAASEASIPVDTSNDNDNDGISNLIDIDDDNDTILDVEESNGGDPLDDDDGDFVPNYRDTDFGPDANNDGIVDSFDFDGDGVPNHFDLDADGDGIFDIQEVNNQEVDTDDDGMTNNPVGFNGLDNTVETDDTGNAAVLYIIPNTDGDPNNNYLDIDSDGDGIVDNIEAQPTDNYLAPLTVVSDEGVDDAYPNGLVPVDTEGDGIPDYLDINSDDDIRDDIIEGWDFDSDGTPETIAAGNDADNDGLDDAYDNNTAQVNPSNSQIPQDFPNIDYDVTEERDWREPMAIVVIISDVSEIEGSELEFTISLVRYIDNSEFIQSTEPVELTLTTIDGSDNAGQYNIAIAPFDYIPVEGVDVVIPAFTEQSSFVVSSLDDIISELDEQFTLNAGITSNNTINSTAEGIGTILDDEPLPTITMNDDIVFEGEDLIFNISIDIPSSTPIVIDMISANLSATANADYEPLSTTFTIEPTIDQDNPNLVVPPFNIATFLDNLNEPDEEYLNLIGTVADNNVTNPNFIQLGTIIDIDPDPLVVINNDVVFEGNTLSFTISLLNDNGELMTNYLPIDFELETVDITTTADWDYLYFIEFDLIPAGQSTLTVQVPTINDNLNEVNEFMNLSASIISGPVSNISNVVLGLGTIIDNDIPNLFTPNNDGQSDVFRIGNLENYPNFKLIIFDRWGGEIYNYSNDSRLSPLWWDGTNNGKPVIEGVYFYELDYNDGVTKPKTGFIQLAR
jgi:gliding motility-associated-like protein